MIKRYLVLLYIGMSISAVAFSMNRKRYKADLMWRIRKYQALARLNEKGKLNKQHQAQFDFLKPRVGIYKKKLLEQKRRLNGLIEINGIRYKKIQPQESDVNLGHKAIVVEGQEAFNLQEIDPIALEDFKDILERGALNLAVVTTLTPDTQNAPERKDREYYTLECLQEWAQQDNARDFDSISESYGRLKSPFSRQDIIDIKAFCIRNENAQPEVIVNHGIHMVLI